MKTKAEWEWNDGKFHYGALQNVSMGVGVHNARARTTRAGAVRWQPRRGTIDAGARLRCLFSLPLLLLLPREGSSSSSVVW
jgi:hypothetical protein